MPLTLTQDSFVSDIANVLDKAKDHEELKGSVALLNRYGKLTFGPGFSLRLDESSMSRNFRDRVFVTRT